MLTDLEEPEGYSILMQVARIGDIKMVAFLCAQGANINAQNKETQETALTLACRGNFKETTDFLIYAGADIEMGAETPLIEAARNGTLDIVRSLLKFKANVHAQTQTRDTALTHACNNGHTDVADLLLNYGAEIEHESEEGTSLMKTCKKGHFFTAELLVLRGANFRIISTTNDTCLSLARAGKHKLIIKLLLAQYAQNAYFSFSSPIDFSLTSPSPIIIAVSQSPITASSDVSQNTAISDRPKAKPVSKKEGKNIQKATSCMKKMQQYQQKQQHRLSYRVQQVQQLQQQNRQLQQKVQQLQFQLDQVQIQQFQQPQMQQQQQHLHTSILQQSGRSHTQDYFTNSVLSLSTLQVTNTDVQPEADLLADSLQSTSTQNLKLHQTDFEEDFRGSEYLPVYELPTIQTLVSQVTGIMDSALPHHSSNYAESTTFANQGQVTTQTQPPSTTISSNIATNEQYEISTQELTLEPFTEHVPEDRVYDSQLPDFADIV